MAPKNPPPAAAGASDDDESSGSEDEKQQQQPPKIAVAKSNNLRFKPPPSDDDDDEEEESDDESGSDEEDNNNKRKQPPLPPPPAKAEKKSQPQPQHESDSGSSDESESESEENTAAGREPPRGADPSIKSASSRPMNSSPTPNSKPKKSAAASSPSSPPPTSSRKKPHPNTSDQNDTETKKRKSFERIWSDDAEQKLLKGIIDFSIRRGTKPSISSADMDALHESLKNSFNGVEFTKAQLVNKIRKLKDKFKSNSTKNGGSPNFTNPVDHNVYELSKKIWGSQENGNSKSEVAAPESDNDEPDVPLKTPKKQRSDIALVNSAGASTGEVELTYPMFWESLTSTGTRKLTHSAAKRLLSKIDSGKSAALEEKFRKYHKVELQNHLRWLELMKEVTKLSCEAIDKSD